LCPASYTKTTATAGGNYARRRFRHYRQHHLPLLMPEETNPLTPILEIKCGTTNLQRQS